MSKQLFDLCTLVIRDCFGIAVSDVFAVVLNHGRVPIPQISRALKVPIRHVENCMVALVQHRLVTYDGDEELDLFEVNLMTAYALLRAGRDVELTLQRNNVEASKIIADLNYQGCTPLARHVESWSDGGLQAAFVNGHAHANGERLSNGTRLSEQDSETSARVGLYEGLSSLALSNVLRSVERYDFVSEPDLESIVERQLANTGEEGANAKSGIKRAKFLYAAKLKKRQLRDVNSLKPKFRDLASEGNPYKRRRLNNERRDQPSTSQPERPIVDKELYAACQRFSSSAANDNHTVLRTDEQKLDVLARSQVLTDMASRYVGPTTSMVYSALLRLCDSDISCCFDPYAPETQYDDAVTREADETTTPVSASQVAEMLPDDFDEDKWHSAAKDKRSRAPAHEPPGLNGTPSHTINGEQPINTIRKNDPESLLNKTARVEEHLQILKSHGRRFVDWADDPNHESSNSEAWSVPFNRLSRDLVQEHLLATVMSIFGRTAARLIRILIDKGRLDDKQLSMLAMTPQRSVRELLGDMEAASFVGLQEIPRENSRQPSRAIYLWYFDAERTRQALLDDSYKAMARLLQRRIAERRKYTAVIEKSERSDVRGHEAKFLSEAEQAALKHWRGIEATILVQLQRLDQGVLVLRDLLPPNALHYA